MPNLDPYKFKIAWYFITTYRNELWALFGDKILNDLYVQCFGEIVLVGYNFIVELNALYWIFPIKFILAWKVGPFLIDLITQYKFNVSRTVVNFFLTLELKLFMLPVQIFTVFVVGMYHSLPILDFNSIFSNYWELDHNIILKYYHKHPFEKSFMHVVKENVLSNQQVSELLESMVANIKENKFSYNNIESPTNYNLYKHFEYHEAVKHLNKTGQLKTMSWGEIINYKKNNITSVKPDISKVNSDPNSDFNFDVNSNMNVYPCNKTINWKEIHKVFNDNVFMQKTAPTFHGIIYFLKIAAVLGGALAFLIVLPNCQNLHTPTFVYTYDEESWIVPTYMDLTHFLVHKIANNYEPIINAILALF